MEALLAAELPEGDGWQFEPKWDGFRCLARRDGDEVTLTSKSGKPLARYFPEVVEMLSRAEGEAIPARRRADHSGRRRAVVRRAAAAPPSGREPRAQACRRETPAELMVFDLLELDGKSLADEPLASAATALEQFFARMHVAGLQLSPMTLRPQGRRLAGWSAAAARSTA